MLLEIRFCSPSSDFWSLSCHCETPGGVPRQGDVDSIFCSFQLLQVRAHKIMCQILFDTNYLHIVRGKVLLFRLAALKQENESQILFGKSAILGPLYHTSISLKSPVFFPCRWNQPQSFCLVLWGWQQA